MIRAFRPNLWALVIGLTFSLAALAMITIPALISLFTDKPLMLTVGKNTAPHAASTGELLGMLAFSMIFIIVGAGLILYWLKVRVEVLPWGIEATNLLGRKSFAAKWNEFTHFSYYNRSYYLHAGSRKVQLFPGDCYAEVYQEIKTNAPQVKLPQDDQHRLL